MSTFSPTPEQHAALNSPTPLLVVAGAGTGKTAVLTHRIAATITSGKARPDQVLALTFTDKAAAEMLERLDQVLGALGERQQRAQVTAKTFHAFGGLVIRENIFRLGFDRPPSVLSAAAAWQLLAAIFDDLTFDAIDISTGQVGAVFSHLLHFFSQCKDHLIDPDRLESYIREPQPSALAPAAVQYLADRKAQIQDLVNAYRRYETAKQEKGLIDFGDQLLLPAQLFARYPDVREAYRRRFRFLFVDEYQDTNHAQRALLLDLINPARPEVMVIGDDDQAIYRWRGAVVQNILRFHQESIFIPGQVACLPMTQNRRSWPPILDLANLAIAGVQARHAKTMGYHESNRQGRATIGHYLAASDRREGEWIAAKIKELEPWARDLPNRKRGYGAFAILCRKRSLFVPVGQALEAAGIPYDLIGGTGFYRHWEIRDILSYLRVLVDPADDLALVRLLLSRRLRLSSRDIFHLGAWVRQQNGRQGRNGDERFGEVCFHLWDAISQVEAVEGLSADARARIARLREEMQHFDAGKEEMSHAGLVAHIIDRTGYRRELLAQPDFEARIALLNLDKLEHLAEQFEEGEEEAGLAGFVEYVAYAVEAGEEEDEVRPVDEETDTVKVMTVHQAKGLEFPIVFIPGLAARVFPSSRRDEDEKWGLPLPLRGDRDYLPRIDLSAVSKEGDVKRLQEEQKRAEEALQLDEERRLFYVAITRAQHQLYFSRAHWYGKTAKPRAASPFWDLVVGSGLASDLGQEECPCDNPNLASHAERAATADKPKNATAVAALLLDQKALDAWLEQMIRQEGHGRWTVLRAQVDEHLASLAAKGPPLIGTKRVDLTCTGLLQYLICPCGYRYTYVDHLPARPSVRAAIGLAVHRCIEELSRLPTALRPDPGAEDLEGDLHASRDEEYLEALTGMAALMLGRGEVTSSRREDIPNRTPDQLAGTGEESVGIEQLIAQYRRSVYASRPATYVEYPFRLPLCFGTLRGRLDRLDRLKDGQWELVDFKSGKPTAGMPSIYRWQLALYALAVREIYRAPASRINAHLYFLQNGTDLALVFEEAELDQMRAETEDALRAIAVGQFPMAADTTHCKACAYSHLCHRSQKNC